jgi:hypothetical protein
MRAFFKTIGVAPNAEWHDGLVFVKVAGHDLDCSNVDTIHDHNEVAFRGWNIPAGCVACFARWDSNGGIWVGEEV